MTDEQVIQQIVNSEQPGNSALAEIHRRSGERLTCAVNDFKTASAKQGNRMLCFTVVLLVIAVVQLGLAVNGCYSSPTEVVATNDAPAAAPELPTPLAEEPAIVPAEPEAGAAEPGGEPAAGASAEESEPLLAAPLDPRP